MLKEKVFGFISLGCDKNRVDGERLLAEVKKHGCQISEDISKVNVLLVNTCAFLNAARQEAIDTVLEYDAYRKGALEKIVVCGCLPQKYGKEVFEGLTEADVLLGINDCPSLFEALGQSYAGERVNFVGKCTQPMPKERVLTTSPHYAYLKIADGCFNHCTYCLIPKIRGKYRSYPTEELIAEAKGLGDLDELILIAQDTTRYGEDLYGENRFVPLIQALSALDNIRRIRLLYCYPEMISDELIAELKRNEKLVPYLDIPLQHSENRILKLMGRRGSREEYLRLFERLREAVPEVAIRTTFIAGFPSETEEEHNRLLDFLQEARLTNCGFFAYSREEDTPAYKMSGQVHRKTKERRVKALYLKQQAISASYLKQYVGKTLPVVCDGVDFERGCFVGRTFFQAPEIDGNVFFTAPHAETGKTYFVQIVEASAYDLFGNL